MASECAMRKTNFCWANAGPIATTGISEAPACISVRLLMAEKFVGFDWGMCCLLF
jgi:hypothetical protein